MSPFRCLSLACVLSCAAHVAAAPPRLPPEVVAALKRAEIPTSAMSVLVQEVGESGGASAPRLAWQASEPVNTASLMKLVTTYAALDLLGPTWNWQTPVWLQGALQQPQGVLEGSLIIKGSGDPTLVLERTWLLLRRVQQQGVHEIRGDIVLDRSAFTASGQSESAFDGEPLRAYNAQPDALLLNYKSILLNFVPEPTRGKARITAEPKLAGVSIDTSAPLVSGPCDDWRAALKIDTDDPARIRFLGNYPARCGEKLWILAYADPHGYNARLIEALWRELGGRLTGRVRDGVAPSTPPRFVFDSVPLAQVVRDINKFSNNVMAQQLFLTLGLQVVGEGTREAARQVVKRWLRSRLGDGNAAAAVVDNGSGLSRDSRLSARLLGDLLRHAWASPVMPELMSSLPIYGLDGTLRSSTATAVAGRAHIKTGSLRDVNAMAGYVLSRSGQRYVLVAVVNHPSAHAARPALEAVLQWTVQDHAASARNANKPAP